VTPVSEGDGIEWRWEATAYSEDFEASRARAVLRHIRAGSEVLEIGVGGGYVLSELSRQAGCRCVGLDVLLSALTASRQRLYGTGAAAWLVQGSGFALPFSDFSFDCVISLGVIEHFPPPRARDMLSEHARVCRPGGRVIVSTPNSLDLVHTIRRLWLGRRYRYWPERSYAPWGLARELREVGLRPVGADGYAPLWSLRQVRSAYLLTATLHKLGLLRRLSDLSSPFLLSILGNLTLQVAEKPLGPFARTAGL
jgi:SAM-dependent methyltransferase